MRNLLVCLFFVFTSSISQSHACVKCYLNYLAVKNEIQRIKEFVEAEDDMHTKLYFFGYVDALERGNEYFMQQMDSYHPEIMTIE